jgi:hypothetical protein
MKTRTVRASSLVVLLREAISLSNIPLAKKGHAEKTKG